LPDAIRPRHAARNVLCHHEERAGYAGGTLRSYRSDAWLDAVTPLPGADAGYAAPNSPETGRRRTMNRTFTHRTALAGAALLFLACGDKEPAGPAINQPPVAVIVAPPTAVRGESVALNGGGSTDPDGDALTFSWSVQSRPDGSTAAIQGATSAEATFVPDISGTFVLRLTVSDGKAQAANDVTLAVEIPILGNIVTPTTLTNSSAPASEPDYRVVGATTILVSAALTIEPGVRIEMAANSRMSIDDGGSIHSVGTAALPVELVGAVPGPGVWRGLVIASSTAANQLVHTTINGAGTGAGGFGAVVISGRASVRNSRFSESATYGVFVSNSGLLDAFQDNVFVGNVSGPVRIPLRGTGWMDPSNDFANSGLNAHVDVISADPLNEAQTWHALAVPYRMASTNTIYSILAPVTIQPGAVFLMSAGGRINVSGGGTLAAVGTTDRRIVFTSSSATPGSHRGIVVFTSSTDNRFDHVDLLYGGGGWANLEINGGTASVTNSTIAHSSHYGINASGDGQLTGFGNNRFLGNATAGLRIGANDVRLLDPATMFVGEPATPQPVLVHSSRVTSPQTWSGSLTAPLLLETTASLTVLAPLTIEPGLTLLVGQNTYILVEQDGMLSAEGTADRPIRFLPSGCPQACPAPGWWRGISVISRTANVIKYAEIGYGGSVLANIYVDGVLKISNSFIHHSNRYGIQASSNAELEESDNTFAANAMGDGSGP
jgi:hypothetical protein